MNYPDTVYIVRPPKGVSAGYHSCRVVADQPMPGWLTVAIEVLQRDGSFVEREITVERAKLGVPG